MSGTVGIPANVRGRQHVARTESPHCVSRQCEELKSGRPTGAVSTSRFVRAFARLEPIELAVLEDRARDVAVFAERIVERAREMSNDPIHHPLRDVVEREVAREAQLVAEMQAHGSLAAARRAPLGLEVDRVVLHCLRLTHRRQLHTTIDLIERELHIQAGDR